MGTGKSLVGKILEGQTGFRRFDTDELISQKLKMPIEDVFSTHGEESFRELETETLRSLFAEEPAIIVAGGGIVLREENVDHLRQLGTVVWLDCVDGSRRACTLAWIRFVPCRRLRYPAPCRRVSQLATGRCGRGNELLGARRRKTL